MILPASARVRPRLAIPSSILDTSFDFDQAMTAERRNIPSNGRLPQDAGIEQSSSLTPPTCPRCRKNQDQTGSYYCFFDQNLVGRGRKDVTCALLPKSAVSGFKDGTPLPWPERAKRGRRLLSGRREGRRAFAFRKPARRSVGPRLVNSRMGTDECVVRYICGGCSRAPFSRARTFDSTGSAAFTQKPCRAGVA